MDVSKLSDNELASLLVENGIIDLGMQRDEMEAVALSLHAPITINPIEIANSSRQSELIVELQGAAGIDAETATHMLEACDWDMTSALNLCMPESPSRSNQSLFTENGNISENAFGNIVGGASDDYEQVYGIRRPDPVKQTRLVDPPTPPRRGGGRLTFYPRNTGGRVGIQRGKGVLGRAEDPTVDWLFLPANHISYPGSFDDVKTMARNESRWILVNIQSEGVLSSHILNRDVWREETIESMCRTNFVLWQRGDTSLDGKEFMLTYGVKTDDLPLIAIIDPRTGGLICKIQSCVEPSVITAILVEFLELNTLSSSAAPVSRNVANSSSYYIDTLTKSSRYRSTENSDVEKPAVPSRDSDTGKTAQSTQVPQRSEVSPPPVPNAEESFGSVPDEPSAEVEPAKIARIGFRLPTGKSVIRRFSVDNSVQALFAFAKSVLQETAPVSSSKMLGIYTAFPRKNLRELLGQSIGEAGLAGTQLTVQWE